MNGIHVLVAIAIWLAAGFIVSGWDFAYFQRKYPSIAKSMFKTNQRAALLITMCGMGSLLWILLEKKYRQYGWLNPWGRKAKIESGMECLEA